MTPLELKEQLKKLPSRPGIYLFKSSSNKPLYIGKALNLKNRVKNYLKTEDSRLIKMLADAKKIDFIQTDSEIEALILESQYIKRYQPTFNIMLRDDKQYSFVGFTGDKYSKIFVTHQPTKVHSSQFMVNGEKPRTTNREPRTEPIGPFTDAGALKTTLNMLRRVFPYCTCKQEHNNYCLNYHIGKCPGICCLKKPVVSSEGQVARDYRKNIKAIKDILSGKKTSLIKNLEKEMKNLSAKQEFEKALELRVKIAKLRRVFENAQIIGNWKLEIGNYPGRQDKSALVGLKKILRLKQSPARIEAYDIANIQGKHAVGAMAVFVNGIPDKNEYRKFKIRNSNIEIRNKSKILNPKSQLSNLGFSASDFRSGGDTAMLKEILTRRFNHPEWAKPDIIVIDGGKAQLNVAKQVVSSRQKVVGVKIIALTKDEKHIGHKIIMENGEEISLSKLSPQIKNLLIQIDSEAHRFAINYYRKLHAISLS